MPGPSAEKTDRERPVMTASVRDGTEARMVSEDDGTDYGDPQFNPADPDELAYTKVIAGRGQIVRKRL